MSHMTLSEPVAQPTPPPAAVEEPAPEPVPEPAPVEQPAPGRLLLLYADRQQHTHTCTGMASA
jgi:hypothetical protein